MFASEERAAPVLFDTDVLIWILRGHSIAARVVESSDDRCMSIVTYMALLQGARDKHEMKTIKSFLTDFRFAMLALTENIGHRASIYMEEYSLKIAMCMADALIAATAVENQQTLCTGNR